MPELWLDRLSAAATLTLAFTWPVWALSVVLIIGAAVDNWRHLGETK